MSLEPDDTIAILPPSAKRLCPNCPGGFPEGLVVAMNPESRPRFYCLDCGYQEARPSDRTRQ